MRAASLSDLLKAGDRVAVSNITGREASGVTVASQKYCGNIVGGWALGKGGRSIDVPGGEPIPVFATAEELLKQLPEAKRPNKVIVYSPPSAVYGEVKEVVEHGRRIVETLYVITEHVSVEVSAKIAQLCREANVDVVGCNSLGVINVHDGVRVGAVGANSPTDSFKPGSVTIISNSGNMVNTMASYLQVAGMGTRFGISTGKDVLILFPLKNALKLALEDDLTKLIVLYIEPGGLYEAEAVAMLREAAKVKPIVAYVTGKILGTRELSLGHAGAVVSGGGTTAEAKIELFDEYFGVEAFDPDVRRKRANGANGTYTRGVRIQSLHHLPPAVARVCDRLGVDRDMPRMRRFRLNPWFVQNGQLAKRLPSRLVLHAGVVPKPYAAQVALLTKESMGAHPSRREMRNASRASSNDGRETRIHGHAIEKQMAAGSFIRSLLLAWMGRPVQDFEAALAERCLIASLSNGPGTISAQATKLSTSAGNMPNTAMIATLACIGDVHGGNGRRAVEYLLRIFAEVDLADPYSAEPGVDLEKIVDAEVQRFSKLRSAAKEAGADYERIPCLGHPVFRNDPVNYDPRERVIARYIADGGFRNIFLDYYHLLAARLKEVGIARNVWAVNLDGAIASVVLGFCWDALQEKQMTVRRACDIAFMLFAVGRVAGAGAEFLDHQDHGTPMDMRLPVKECIVLTRPAD